MRPRPLVALLLGALLLALLPAASIAADEATPFPWPPSPWVSQPEPGAPSAIPVVRKGGAATGAVALTFDDGYNSRACSLIADKLRQHGAVGTFFINGHWLARSPAKWRRILEGMEFGNHTRSHPDLRTRPHPVVVQQIRSNEYIHEQVLGRPMLKVLRPPYGSHSERIGRIAGQLGYEHIVMWNVDTADWRPTTRVNGVIRRATGAAPGSIILMHCGPGTTVKALPHIIRHYKRRGIELAGLSTVLKGARGSKRGADASRYGS